MNTGEAYPKEYVDQLLSEVLPLKAESILFLEKSSTFFLPKTPLMKITVIYERLKTMTLLALSLFFFDTISSFFDEVLGGFFYVIGVHHAKVKSI